MKRLLAFAAAVALAYLSARVMIRPAGVETADLDAPSRALVEERSPTALPDAGQPWSPPVEKGNVRVLKVADVPAPGRTRTPEEIAEAQAVDAAARSPRLGGVGFPGADYGSGRAPTYRAGDLTAPRREEGAPEAAARGEEEAPAFPGAAGKAKAKAKTGGNAPPAASEESSWAGQTKGIVEAAKDIGFGASGRSDAGQKLLTSLANRALSDAKATSSVRDALSNLGKSGKPMTQDAVEGAAAEALSAQGLPAEPEDVQAALAGAQAPDSAPPSPQAVAASNAELTRDLPGPQQIVEINKRALEAERNRPTAPTGPAPKGALEAYDMFRDALLKAERDFGVKPHHVLGLLYIETRWGANIGNVTARNAAFARMNDMTLSDAKRRDAERQMLALKQLRDNGELGGYSLDKAPSNPWVAMGPGQFLPNSAVAYWRSHDGSARNPYDRVQANYASAHYLYKHGANRDIARAIFGYNHSQKYVNDVLRVSAQIEAAIRAREQTPPKK